MARSRHFHVPHALALASIFGVSTLAGCGGSNDDELNQQGAASGRRQRSESPSESDMAASPSSRNEVSSDAEAEATRNGELAETEAEAEDPRASDGETEDAEPAPARVFSACVTDGGAYDDCDRIYVTMQQSDPPQCVQLTIDNCASYGRRTLTVDAPARWELSSGSVGTNPDNCELGAFSASNTVLVDASGTISWDAAAAPPDELVLELTLEPSRTGGDVPNVDIATAEPVSVSECPD